MKQFQCEICGGNTVIQLDEKTFECQDCGLQYDIYEVEKLIVVGEENHREEPSQEEIVVPLGVAINSEPTDKTIENQDEFKLEEPFSNDETGVDETNSINSSESATDSAICEDTTETAIEANEEDTKITPNTTELDVEEPATDSSKIEGQSSGENQEQTTNAIIVEDSVPEPIENVEEIDNFQGENDEINELEIDENGETVDKIAVVPWFRNKKVIIPSVVGLTLVILITVLSIILFQIKNIPISDEASSDVHGSDNSSQIDSETNSNVTSDSSENNTIDSSKSEVSDLPNSNKGGNVNQNTPTTTNDSPLPPGTVKNADGTYTNKSYHENGNLSCVTTYYSNYNKKQQTWYSKDGVKTFEEFFNTDGSQAKQIYYKNGVIDYESNINKGETTYYFYDEYGKSQRSVFGSKGDISVQTNYDFDGNISSVYEKESNKWEKRTNYYKGFISSIYEYKLDLLVKETHYQTESDKLYYVIEYTSGVKTKETVYHKNGKISKYAEFDLTGTRIKINYYDENGNDITDQYDV